MEESWPLTELFRRHREGDPDAAGQIFTYYAQRLCRLAEHYLSRRLAGRLEGEDVVQSAFRTFFHRTTKGEFQIDSRAQLWQLLVKITVLKARAKGREHTAGKRNAALESTPADDAWLEEAREPGPAEAAILADHIEAILDGLPPLYCDVLQMRLAGHTVADIATHLSLSRQTIYRALDLLQQRLARAS